MRGHRSGLSALGWSLVVCHGFGLCPQVAVSAPSPAPFADQPALVPGGGVANPPPNLSDAGAKRARALALYYEGLTLARRREPARAIERYLEVLKLDPTHVRLAKRLADTYVLAGKLDDALAILENTLRENPDRPEVFMYLSEFCASHHNNSEAVKARGFSAARELVEKFPASSKAYGNLVALLLIESRRDEAAAVIDRAAARHETNPHFWLDLAGYAAQVWSLRKEANHPKVQALFRKALDLAPDDPEVNGAVADYYAQTARFTEAVALYEKAIRQRPDDLKAREKLAHCLFLAERPDEAVKVWRALLEINPASQPVHEALAKFYTAQGDRKKAIEHRAAALRFSEEHDLNGSLRLVREMLAADMPREALAVLERAEFSHPESPEPAYHAAVAHGRLDEHQKAVDAFHRAAEIAAADQDMAAQFLNESFYFEWGIACTRAGKVEVAEEKFRKAIELVPKSEPSLAAKSYNALGYLWLEHDRNLDEAGQLIERALKFDPDSAAYLDSLGWFYFKKSDPEKALEVLRKAEAAGQQRDAENLDHQAQVLRALGQHGEANEMLSQAIALPRATPAMRERLKAWRAAP